MLSLRCAWSRSSGAQASCAQLRTNAALGAGTTSAAASPGMPGMRPCSDQERERKLWPRRGRSKLKQCAFYSCPSSECLAQALGVMADQKGQRKGLMEQARTPLACGPHRCRHAADASLAGLGHA